MKCYARRRTIHTTAYLRIELFNMRVHEVRLSYDCWTWRKIKQKQQKNKFEHKRKEKRSYTSILLVYHDVYYYMRDL